MALFPEFLYRPSLYDEAKATALPSRLLTNDISTGTATSVFVQSLPVPNDMVLALAGFNVWGASQAAEILSTLIVRVTDTAFNEQALLASRYSGAVAGPNEFSFYQDCGGMVLLGGERIRVQGVFNLGVASKTVRLNLFGTMYPRGNWQQGAI